MNTQLTKATESIGGAIASLVEQAETNPRALELLGELVNVTKEFAEGMEVCHKGAQFLKHHNLRVHYAESLSPIPNNDELLEYLYNCVCCVQESLKALIVKSFSEKYLAQIRTFPNSVYQQFFEAFKRQISIDCNDEETVKVIHQYSDAVLNQINA
jgi:hypothetical protein